DDEPLVAQSAVECVEAEPRMVGKVERSDDKALHLRVEVGAKSKRGHSVDQHVVIAPVTRAARHHASFLLELLQGLLERKNGMRGRGIAKLAVLFQSLELIEQVEAETAR